MGMICHRRLKSCPRSFRYSTKKSTYLYSQVLALFYNVDTIFNEDSGVDNQLVSFIKLSLGVSHAFKKTAIFPMPLFQRPRTDVKEVATGNMLPDHGWDGASSLRTSTRSAVESCYVVGVLRWWKECVLKTILGNKITVEVFLTKPIFNRGDICMSISRLEAVSTIVGTVFKTGTCVVNCTTC